MTRGISALTRDIPRSRSLTAPLKPPTSTRADYDASGKLKPRSRREDAFDVAAVLCLRLRANMRALRANYGSACTRQRAIDHGDRVRQAIDRDKRAEARAFLLSEQHLIKHVEPVQRNALPAILAFLDRVEERLAPAPPLHPSLHPLSAPTP